MEIHRSPKLESSVAATKVAHLSPQPQGSVSPESETDMWDLGWIFAVLRRKALLILQIAFSTTTLAAAALFLSSSMTKPKYEGRFQLQVEPATVDAKLSRSFLSAQTAASQTDTQSINLEQVSTLDYETQIRILTSPRLMAPIIEKIQRVYPDITYDTLTKQLMVERVKITKDGKELGAKLLDISYKAENPQEILFVLDQVSQSYLKYSLKERQTNIRQGSKFIEEQLPLLRERVDTLRIQLEALRQQNNLMDPEKQGEEFSQLLTSIKQKQVDSLSKVVEAQSRYQTLQKQLRRGNAIAVLSEVPSFQKLLDQYQELEGQLATSSARLNEDSPPIKSLRRKQENIQTLLNQEANRILAQSAAQVEIAQTQQEALAETESRINRQFQKLPVVARQYANLTQELQIATETLSRFLSKNEALSIDAAQQEVPWELTAPPALLNNVAGKPENLANKNKRLLLVLAGILATLVAIGIAFLIEIIQDIIHTPDELKHLSKLPNLGNILPLEASNFLKLESMSFLSSSEPLYAFKDGFETAKKKHLIPFWSVNPSSHQSDIAAFTESFNMLFSNICSSSAEASIRSIAISSPSAHEGKSTIAIYLAKAAAMAGKKVLLVDANLRSPHLHQYLQMDNTKGLSDLIATEVNINEVIQASPWEDNLFVLTAGEKLSHPVRLLSSPKLEVLMQKFTSQFDFIVYDTPSSLDYADVSLITSQTNGVVMVVSLGKTKRNVLSQAIEGLNASHLTTLGIVTNTTL